MALDISKFIQRFVDEAREHVSRLESGLGGLGSDPLGARDGIDALFRSAHTIKGSARMLKLASIAETAHHLEDVLGALRDGKIQPDPEIDAVLMRAVDGIGGLVEQLARDGSAALPAQPDQALCDRLARAARGEHATTATTPAPASAPGETASPASAAPVSSPPAAPEATPGIRSPDSVRVRMDKLDTLVKLMGELSSNQSRLRHQLGMARALDATATQAAARAGGNTAELARALHAFTLELRDLTLTQERLVGELNDRALGMRMLPLSLVFDPVARVARELGRALGKEIQTEVSGGEIELDRHIIDHLSDALVHLLRNAIDHGIEPTEQRLAAGKPRLGRVRLAARQEGGAVLIALSDDGRGLDRDAIIQKALQKGLIDEARSRQLGDEQVADLIFQPGFSTSAIITEVSGRGVGMDVVKRAITDDLQGAVTIASRPGLGTTLTLTLPLSLALMRVLLFEAAGHCFGLGAPHVSELLRSRRAETIQVAGRPAVVLRNELVPLIPLADLLDLPASSQSSAPRRRGDADATLLVIIIGVRQAKLGLVVDALVDERDMMLKPLPKLLRTAGGLVGGMVVTGSNALISLLHAPALLEAARRLRGEAIAAAAQTVAHAHASQHILVVDDSLNTREIEKEVLEASGYRVTLAEDGLDAWQKALGGHFDAILTDVEMPGLDGFSLTAKLRENDQYRSTPIVILTSRQAQEDKQRGIQVGADAYIVKGDFDQSSLVDTLRNLLG